MEKLVYVLWKREEDTSEEFRGRMLGPVAEAILAEGARGLSMNLVDEFVAHTKDVRMTKFDPPMAGTVSLWLDSSDDRARCEQALAEVTSRRAGYLVVESVPLVNTTQTAPLGERTPGINVVACIERPEWISHEEWIEHWHGHHKIVALETQSTFLYIRNVVVRALTEGAPPWAGIVEEGFPAEAVTDPMLWYCAEGSQEKMQANIARMMESCQAFLDIDRVESNSMSEYRIKELQ